MSPLPVEEMTGRSPMEGRHGPAGRRVVWVDVARGIGIVLMVFGHVWRGLHSARLLPDGPAFRFVDDWIYSFHMPLFFFLSGLFARRAATDRVGVFLADKAGTIVYPYLLWSLLQGGLNIALSSHTNAPLEWSTLLRDIASRPYAQFWFLYALLLIQIAAYGPMRLGLHPLAILAIGVAVRPIAGASGLALPGVIWLALTNLPYFALGLASSGLLSTSPGRRWSPILIASSVVAGAVLALGVERSWSRIEGVPMLMAVVGIAGLTSAAIALVQLVEVPWLAYLGRISLQIYLAHVIALAAARIILLRVFHVEDLAAHLLLGTAAGLIVPAVLVEVERFLGFPVFFQIRSRRPGAERPGLPTPPMTPEAPSCSSP